MYRGTTPTLSFKFPFEQDIVDYVWVTLVQGGVIKVDKKLQGSDISISDDSIKVTLSQKETLRLSHNKIVEMQIRVKFNDGSAVASNIMTESVEKILKDGEI